VLRWAHADHSAPGARWENRSGATARVAFILIDGAFTRELRDTLGTEVPGGG
jgi:hypothetical protein